MKLNNSLRFSTKTEIVLFLLVIFTENGLLLVPAALLSRLEMCDDHARQHHNNQNYDILHFTNVQSSTLHFSAPSFMCVHAPCFMHFRRALVGCYPSPKSFRIIRYVLEEILQSHISGLTYEPLNTQIKTYMQERRDVQWADRPPSSRIYS